VNWGFWVRVGWGAGNALENRQWVVQEEDGDSVIRSQINGVSGSHGGCKVGNRAR